MKNFISFILIALVIISCSTTKNTSPKNQEMANSTQNDTVRIANDELQYEVIIIDPGFNSWLISRAQPRNFYTQSYMETRNRMWVTNWNINVNSGRNRNLFEMTINYDNHIDYGYEVNYMLFNYLTYFQITNNIQLGGFPARI
ncbi:hypothetical protein J2X31_001254 [Flavobacterium arsenatis]|uniref:Lipoprotein n=1 Tax=Flavobacterium arsenatis TaxID=1484332 RepID=A0ABU1TMQ8_9FLAO|nr:DUF6146 family protein [Flavobacterium arsenatis]MDR6967247.1 hypothetical protein [Flavobacterium arsenatis]